MDVLTASFPAVVVPAPVLAVAVSAELETKMDDSARLEHEEGLVVPLASVADFQIVW